MAHNTSRTRVLAYAEDLLIALLGRIASKNRGEAALQNSPQSACGPCRRNRFSSSKSNPVTYQTGSNVNDNVLREKWCPRCEAHKAASEFYSDSSNKTGYSSYCKECLKANVREHRKNPEKRRRPPWPPWNGVADRGSSFLALVAGGGGVLAGTPDPFEMTRPSYPGQSPLSPPGCGWREGLQL